MKELLNKGKKKVATYMRQMGFELYDCTETENGYIAEYYITCAGTTAKTVYITFNKNWRVIEVA